MSQGQVHRGKTSALLIFILSLVGTAPCFAKSVVGLAGSSLNIVSVGEEVIGRGQEYHLAKGGDSSTADFTGTAFDDDHDGQVDRVAVVIFDQINRVVGNDRTWQVVMLSTGLKKPLTPGTYNGAVEPRKADGKPGLDILAYGRGCGASPTVSFFTISDIKVQKNVTTGDWELAKLVANFRFRCGATDERPEDPTGLTGDITFIGDVVGAGETPGGGGNNTPPEPADVTIVLPSSFSQEGFSTFNMANASSAGFDFDVATTSTFNEAVHLSAVSDPEGLDVSVSPVMFAAPGRGKAHLTISTKPTTFPRDYRVDIIGTTTNKVYSTSVLVALTCDPPKILGNGQPRNSEVSRGNVANLEVTPIGSGPFTYQWYAGYSGQTSFPVPGATGRQFQSGALTDTGYYWVRVSNACGSVDSQTATVNVRTPSAGVVPRH
jgi:hypothetical protein